MAGTVKVGTFRVQSKQTLTPTTAKSKQRVAARAQSKQASSVAKSSSRSNIPRPQGKYNGKLGNTPFGVAAADTTPPTVPQNLVVTAHTSTTVSISWDASTDIGSGVKEYSVRRDGTLIATVPVGSTTYLDTALTPATTYAYTVRARDVANNTSVDSNTANGTTDAVAGDTTPPTAPANLIVTGQTSSTIDVAWDASTDNVAVTGYIVYRQQPTTTAEITCDVDPQSVSTTTFVDYGATPDVADGSVTGPTISTAQNIDIQLLGLTPNTVYWYRVRAANTNGTSISKLGYFIVPSTTPATFYVSPTGLDTGTGDGTLAHPYATLQKAFTRCQTTGGDQVVMLAGSYGSQTMTKNFTGLTLVKPAPGATVNIASVAFTSGCRLVAFIGVNCDGHGLNDVDGTHLWEAFGSSASVRSQDLYWLDGNITAIGKTSSAACIRASTWSQRCYFHNVQTQAGGFGFKSFDSSSTATDWPAFYWFVDCDFGPDHTWDCWHADVFKSFRVYESRFTDPKSLSNYTNPAYTSEEHHDAIQITGGDDLLIERCVMTDAHPSDANLAADPSPQPHRPANGLIGGPDTAAITNVTMRNCVVNRWLGCALNINGIGTFKAINCTFHRAPGPGNGSTADLTIDGGSANTNTKLLNNIAHQGFISSATPTPTIQGNHWIEDRSATNNKGSSFTTGAVTFTSNDDVHLANGTQTASTGGIPNSTDSDVPTQDVEGRGRGSLVAKGAYRNPTIASPANTNPAASVPAWAQVGSTSSSVRVFTDTDLLDDHDYTYKVVAFDAAGNVSDDSLSATGHTDIASDAFIPGPSQYWGNFATDATHPGHCPSLTVFKSTCKFGPQTSTYYDNATARSQPRGTLINSDNGKYYYYPRSLGHDVTAITSGTFFTITSAALVAEGVSIGESILLNDLVGTNASGGLHPRIDGTYTVKSVSGNNITFNESWTGTGVYDAAHPGYAIKLSKRKNENYYEVNLTQAQIEAHAVCPQTGTVFFTQDTDGYWRWTGGYCNRWIVTGTGVATLKIRIPGNLDVINASPEWATYGLDGDPQIMNPYCCVQWNGVLADVNGMSCQATAGGTMAYGIPLGTSTTIHGITYADGLAFPQGESISYQDVQGLFQGVINIGYFYDAEKLGGQIGPIQWKNCCHRKNKNAEASGGGHTDCYQVFDMDNTGLGNEPTFEYVSFQAGGNSQFFLNSAAGGGGGLINNVWAYHCISWKGNKFCDFAQSSNIGARACWVAHDPAHTDILDHQPTAIDFGNGPPNHPYPTGTVIWPLTTDPNANLYVDTLGATTPIDRPAFPSTPPTFSYVN